MSKSGIIAATLALAVASTAAHADCRRSKPTLRNDVEATALALEKLDDTLHEADAPESVLKILHHFEEGLLELAKDVDEAASCKAVFDSFQHFHEDVQLLYRELSNYPGIFHRSPVLTAWNALVPSFIRLQSTVHRP